MNTQVLTDKNLFPTEEIIFSHINKAKTHWLSLFEFIKSNPNDLNPEWRYYNDGKSWLMKVLRKTKTVFWLSVKKNSFSVTFYFTDKTEKEIYDSPISDELKDNFKNGKRFGKIRAITVNVKSKKDVQFVKTLIEIKLNTL
jgi:hypothetical protein